jgi:hypothetical protein
MAIKRERIIAMKSTPPEKMNLPDSDRDFEFDQNEKDGLLLMRRQFTWDSAMSCVVMYPR